MSGTPALKPEPAEVWITGIGLATSLGEGLDANWDALNAGRINVDDEAGNAAARAFARSVATMSCMKSASPAPVMKRLTPLIR